MSVKTYVLECDNCGYSSEDAYHPDMLDDKGATEYGWFFLKGPETKLGGDGERVYCSAGCLEEGLGL